MTPGEIAHCTDIYSLGVLLYELLVDELLLEREVVRKAAFHEILRRILEEDPPTPSVHWTRLNLEETRRRAQERRTDPTALRHKLRGDLDWITMKALAKEPAQSYASATELAADVRRHLRHEPGRDGNSGRVDDPIFEVLEHPGTGLQVVDERTVAAADVGGGFEKSGRARLDGERGAEP